MRAFLLVLVAFSSLLVSPALAVSDENYDHRPGMTSHVSKNVASTKRGRTAYAYAPASTPSYSSSSLVTQARRYIGTNPTGRRELWCGAFMNMVLEQSGYRGGGNLAKGYLSYGRRLAGPQVGALAIFSRGKRGGHVGVVSDVAANGNITIVSGNHNNTVAESVYPRSRAIGFVMPI